MNLTSAQVMWGGTHAPDCRGAPIITVLLGKPWSFTSALGDRVRKGLYGGSIVIDNTTKRDEGFYSICSSSYEPLLVIELVFTGWASSHPVSLGETRMNTGALGRRWSLWSVLVSVSLLVVAAVI